MMEESTGGEGREQLNYLDFSYAGIRGTIFGRFAVSMVIVAFAMFLAGRWQGWI